MNEVKLYNQVVDNILSSGEIVYKEQEINSLNKKIVVDHITQVICYFDNGKKVILDQVSKFNFSKHYKYKEQICIINEISDLDMYNECAENGRINKIEVTACACLVDHPDHLITMKTSFDNLKVVHIIGGFNTESNMDILLESN